MAHFRIELKDGINTDAYWVGAESPGQARKLVALNISEASNATDAEKFDCIIDSGKQPPDGFIHRRLHGPVAITKF